MGDTAITTAPEKRVPHAYIYAGVAAAAMVGTLPGRTFGLGLVTEPLLKDLHFERVPFAAINLWATLLGSVFCFPVGRLIDRLGIRPVLGVVLVSLGATVIAMSRLDADGPTLSLPAIDVFSSESPLWVPVPIGLFLLVLLTRGLGQAALSIVSLALVGKVGGRKSGPIIGVYSFLSSAGFMAAFAVIQELAAKESEWRTLWAGIGCCLVGFGAISALFFRDPKIAAEKVPGGGIGGYTLGEALATPAFWLFALATSYYGMVVTGTWLFQQSILQERGFDRSLYLKLMEVTPVIGLLANLLTGWLSTRFALGRLMAASMVVLAGALLAFPSVEKLWQVYAYAAAMGIAGGIVTVLFYAVWGQAFGPRNLGQIQGAAQFLTVLASALGPLLLATAHRAHGSYVPIFRIFAFVALGFGATAWFVKLPEPKWTAESETTGK